MAATATRPHRPRHPSHRPETPPEVRVARDIIATYRAYAASRDALVARFGSVTRGCIYGPLADEARYHRALWAYRGAVTRALTHLGPSAAPVTPPSPPPVKAAPPARRPWRYRPPASPDAIESPY